jgi:uncharacterized protein with PQ loop repeat
LWLTYGFWKGEWPLVIGNAITLVLASTILCVKIRRG